MPEEEREGFTSQPRMPELTLAKLPFRRWLIQLIVKDLLKPVLIPIATAAATAASGWYVVGQYQVKAQVEHEVQVRDDARILVQSYMEDVRAAEAPGEGPQDVDLDGAMAELRDRWGDTYAHPVDPSMGPLEPEDFPEQAVMEQLQRANLKR